MKNNNKEAFTEILEKIGFILNKENELKAHPKDKVKIKELVRDYNNDIKKFTYSYIDSLIKEKKSFEEIEKTIKDDINTLTTEGDEKLNKSVKYLEEKLMDKAHKEVKKCPTRRMIEKYSTVIVICILLVVYFGFRFNSRIDTSHDIASNEGMKNVAKIHRKIQTYDKYITTKTRRGGFIKMLVFWPIKPTDSELNYFYSYVHINSEINDMLIEENIICGGFKTVGDMDDDEADEFYEFLDKPTSFIEKYEQSEEGERILYKLTAVYMSDFPCNNDEE